MYTKYQAAVWPPPFISYISCTYYDIFWVPLELRSLGIFSIVGCMLFGCCQTQLQYMVGAKTMPDEAVFRPELPTISVQHTWLAVRVGPKKPKKDKKT